MYLTISCDMKHVVREEQNKEKHKQEQCDKLGAFGNITPARD